MKKCRLTVTALCLSALMLFSPTVMKAENPFMAPYGTPFNMPPFDKISNSDYLPAFEEGIRQHNQEIEAIINNRAVADFDNTIAALDNAGQLLENVTYVFNGLYDACSTPELQTLGEQILPMLSKHNDEVMMNERLFSRVKQVYDNRKKFNLTKPQERLLEKYYKQMVRCGALLSRAARRGLASPALLVRLAFGCGFLRTLTAALLPRGLFAPSAHLLFSEKVSCKASRKAQHIVSAIHLIYHIQANSAKLEFCRIICGFRQ